MASVLEMHSAREEPNAINVSQANTGSSRISKIMKYTPTLLARIGCFLFYGSMAFAVYAGLKIRHLEYFTPEKGVGYQLGVVGGSLMLILLLYPLRKKSRFMQGWGPVKYWFRIHMALGVLGPVCILFHANFSLGSTNSNVALFCMIVVAGSGLIGRSFYSKIHYGLYGSRANLIDLRKELEDEDAEIKKSLNFAPEVCERLGHLAQNALHPPQSSSHTVLGTLFHGLKTEWIYWQLTRFLHREIKSKARSAGWNPGQIKNEINSAKRWIRVYLETLNRINDFGFYSRVFSLWHVLHLPLFFLLLVAGAFHVFAVHAY